jgi:hypothetical protein
MGKTIYINKINYYTNKLKNENTQFNKNKLKKYLIKLGGYNNISQPLEYDEKRTPSYSDRILYKSNHINPINYGVYYDNHLIRLSDHLLVYGEFTFNNKTGIIFTWNMGSGHTIRDKHKGIAKLIVDFELVNEEFDMIIFCLQESVKCDAFPKLLIDGLVLTNYKVSIDTSSSLLDGFNVRLIVFHKTIGMDINKVEDYNVSLIPELSSRSINLESNIFKYLLRNKTCIGINIDGLTIISCHFPLNTKEKDLGNDLRINAFKKIKEEFKDSKNILLAGDLNFRIIDGDEQLTTYLKNQNDKVMFKEFEPELKEKTCKLKIGK